MWENFVFLVIFDTCDVVYNWSISLLSPNVLDNLFGLYKNYLQTLYYMLDLNIFNSLYKHYLLNIIYIYGYMFNSLLVYINITF